jgi:hypothetical protein
MIFDLSSDECGPNFIGPAGAIGVDRTYLGQVVFRDNVDRLTDIMPINGIIA